MKDSQIEMLFTPANTPEFSPIENMFGYVKNTLLKDMDFISNLNVAVKVSHAMFGLD